MLSYDPTVPHIVSLGAGVQSSTLVLRAALETIYDQDGKPYPKPIAAIFADVGDEPEVVYNWVNNVLIPTCSPHFPVIIASKYDGRMKLSELATTPRTSKKSGNIYTKPGLPVFIQKEPGKPPARNPRQCTGDWKIDVVHKHIKSLLGIKRAGQKLMVNQWIGISTDEADRMKDSVKPWIRNVYPLIEMNMSRTDCYAWLEAHGFHNAPRSACTYCPFHSDVEWLKLKNGDAKGFLHAVELEKRLQAIAKMPNAALKGTPFLHRSCLPLDQVVFKAGAEEGQFRNECCGVCDV